MTFFRLRALALAPQLGVSTAFVDEHINVFIAALGVDWLAKAATDVPPGVPLPFPRHPIGAIVATAGTHQVAEALEIGEYLRILHAVPNIADVVTLLRGQYYQTLLQLAFASRIQRAGGQLAGLEPPASGGRLSDILFTCDGHAYRAECFRPTYKTKGDVHYEMVRLANDCFEAMRGHPFVFSIAIDLDAPPTPTLRRQTAAVVKAALAKVVVDTRDPKQDFPALLLRGPVGTVSVARALATRPVAPPILVRHPSFPHTRDDFDLFVRTGLAEESTLTGVHGQVNHVAGASHVAIWLPESERGAATKEDPEASVGRLGRKIESKLVQVRPTGTEQRVLIVDAWQTRLLESPSCERAERLRRKIVEAHDHVVALMMVCRDWMPRLGRHGYRVVPLTRSSAPTFPEAFLRGLSDVDAV